MRKLKILLGLAIAALLVATGWQMFSACYGNLELAEDLRDISADIGTRVGLSAPSSDEELRAFVIKKANDRGIQLEPTEVTVSVSGEGKSAVISLAADYRVKINMLVYSFPMHFHATNAR
jgi:hypothetical protein